MPLLPEIYCTTAQVAAAWPKFASLGDQEQADLVADASAAVQNYIRRQLLQSTWVETHDGPGGPRIWLKNPPVVAVAQVLVNEDPLDNTGGDAWSFKPDTGELRRGNGLDDLRFASWFPRGRGNVRVTYAGGLALVPGPVKRATILVVRWLYDSARQSWAMSSESIGDYSYTINPMLAAAHLPPPAVSLLAPYVLDEIPF